MGCVVSRVLTKFLQAVPPFGHLVQGGECRLCSQPKRSDQSEHVSKRIWTTQINRSHAYLNIVRSSRRYWWGRCIWCGRGLRNHLFLPKFAIVPINGGRNMPRQSVGVTVRATWEQWALADTTMRYTS